MSYSFPLPPRENIVILRANIYLLSNRALWLGATGQFEAARIAYDWAEALHMMLCDGSWRYHGSFDLLPARCLTLRDLL